MAIVVDIGYGCTASGLGIGEPYVAWASNANTANNGGVLDTMKLSFDPAYGNAAGVLCGTLNSSRSDRDYETIGSVTAGNVYTFTGLSCDVLEGDWLGVYASAGQIRMANTPSGYLCYLCEANPFGTADQSWGNTVGYLQAYATGSAVIDIGAGAINRSSYRSYGYTCVDVNNPAIIPGVLTTIKVFAVSGYALEGFKCGTFSGSGTSYDDRDYETIGAVTAGSEQTFTGLSIQVEAGDFIGGYWSAGRLEASTSGFSGYYYKSGDQFDKTAQTYTLASGDALSLYGTGEQEWESRSAEIAIGLSVSASRVVEFSKAAAIAIGHNIVSAIGTNAIIRSAFIAIGLSVNASASKRILGYVLKRIAKFATTRKTVRFIE